MIQQSELKISIHNECVYAGSEYFHIRTMLPQTLNDALVHAMKNTRTCGFDQMAKLGDMDINVYDGDEEDGELIWFSFRLGNVGMNFSARQEGLQLDMSCEKHAHGDDALDWTAWREQCAGKLPDDFWIEPAAILRKLLALAATQH
ncbi:MULTISPECIES: hypothetical protein [unclassified Ensifer]|uniref:hypothetical protein n=1 Tax=unclassified Ensifer TaxID=2633371 RepID=UPI0008137BD8|nr:MULTISPECIES: hypothetical protein [unclassified Ensifer]OCP21941.1 hypothetical protein BC361_25570 [Ensifer sp. LC54]OCP23279.1 hypothetical protein BC363_25195 [Ensifer sp. LC384]